MTFIFSFNSSLISAIVAFENNKVLISNNGVLIKWIRCKENCWEVKKDTAVTKQRR
jgi:hypothetical protein